MDLRNKVMGFVGAAAVCLSLAAAPSALAGVPASDDIEVSVDIVCPELNDVEITGDGVFSEIDLNDGAPYTSSTINPLTVEVNVGCYLEAWHVDAEITAFTDGLLFFPGSWFSLTALADSGPEVTANSSDFDPTFPGAGEAEEIFGTTNLITSPPIPAWWIFPAVPGVELDIPAPGTSWADFQGNLELQGPVFPGEYTADLTVILVKDPNPIVTWP